MKAILLACFFLSLLCATSCTASFKGSFLNVDEFKFGPIPNLQKDIKEDIELLKGNPNEKVS